ncbi:Potassium channel tetramerisation-type BTB domain [Lasallia pustulata]|uniref:Potassium channel tetramerisation-type BTB domain n=1 Tax=Lasallia pustulata TaxID=136370 RepID=A0A1W5CXX2_9LECA|nr:Potassium channel tetramerisation-type BTB domain [Lasallia pustulata]
MSDPESFSQIVPVSPSPPAGTQITLQVGERRFVTMRETLIQESGFFTSLLSGRWDNAQADGSYYVDADAELFEHILRYLRRGMLPIFYDNSKGHDYALYLEFLEEAKYFQISRLETWLKDQTYLQAMKIAYSAVELEGADGFDEITKTDMEVEYHPVWRTKRVYICPRSIDVHRGNPLACGRSCRNAQGNAEDEYEDEEVLKTLVIRKRTVFDQHICVAGR